MIIYAWSYRSFIHFVRVEEIQWTEVALFVLVGHTSHSGCGGARDPKNIAA